MSILVFNAGSSTLKFRLFENRDPGELKSLVGGVVSAFGPEARYVWTANGASGQLRMAANNHYDAASRILDWLQNVQPWRSSMESLTAVGHRVVHGGGTFAAPIRITDHVLTMIDSFRSLAPIHNPVAVQVIRASQTHLGHDLPMVAVFDTAFYQNLPDYARTYAVPAAWTRDFGIRRYGFHGIAHRYLYERSIEISEADPDTSRVITLQLGQGCSITAIRGGNPIETSMGFTPMEGLIMATRSGDVDAGILLYLAMQAGFSPEQLNTGLNHEAGLLGLSGVSSDMRELLKLETEGHEGARLAVEAFCHRARKYIGAYLAVLGGADAIVFGGGMGEHAPQIRARICANMEWCGLTLDESANAGAIGVERRISAPFSTPAVYVIPVNEELLIARDTRDCLKSDSS